MRTSRLLQDDGETPLMRHLQASLYGCGAILLALWSYEACETSYYVPEEPPYALPVRIDFGRRTPEVRLLVSPSGVEAQSLDGNFSAGWRDFAWLERRLRTTRQQHPGWWVRIESNEETCWQDIVHVIGIMERMSDTRYGLH